ncbi:HAD family hydrolase [Agathobaculum sp. Marseille-P7918]|uniref:HAD family hydrolase n=1 Tax=Agathobaculum sp. Marseille-P7918 TaxID=2479843 RepID=UPI000F62FB98|nr:HAD family hydrolase [Agathobaculum sp. Marseille-P7918]
MDRTLFASDFDGTLCRNACIDDRTLAAVRRYRTLGGRFGVCSGRDPGTLKAELARFDLECDFLILLNGARIEADGQCLRKRVLQGYEKALSLLRDRCLFFTMVGDGEAYMYRRADVDPVQTASASERVYIEAIGRTHHMLPQADALREVYQISCRTASECAAVALADELHALGLSAWPNCEYVDVVPTGVNKASAVAEVCAHFGVPAYAACTAGDGRNDMEMLSRFAGFAMAQAEDCVKQAAARTAESVGEALEWICREEKA